MAKIVKITEGMGVTLPRKDVYYKFYEEMTVELSPEDNVQEQKNKLHNTVELAIEQHVKELDN